MTAGKDWHRLAESVRERRVELGMTQEDARAAGGPSTATMRLIEGALQESYQPATLRDLEKVLRWERGSIGLILAGGDPVPLTAANGALAPTGLPVIDDAGPVEAVAPFVYQVEMELERAEREHGREPAGREIFGAGQEANSWDHSGFNRDAKIRLIATLRWIAFKARNAEQGGSKTGLGLRVLPGG